MSTQICCRDRCEIEVVLLKRKDFGSITGRCKNACKKYYLLVWFILKRKKFSRLWKKNLYHQNLRFALHYWFVFSKFVEDNFFKILCR